MSYSRRRNRQSAILMEAIENRVLLSTTLTTIASFAGSGIAQGGTVIDSRGDIFGVTQATNTAFGTLYELPAGSNTIQTLVTFTGPNGSNPNSSLLIDSAGDIFGTTASGGSSGFGIVWELPASATSITRLASYTGVDGNQLGNGLARDIDGNIFVIAQAGANGNGAVLELPAGASNLSVLDSFPSGSEPVGRPVLDSAGDIFGVTLAGGDNGSGSIYEIAANGATATLASFSNGTPSPQGDILMDSSGNLFGVTASTSTGQNISTVWELPVNTANIVTLASNTAADGTYIEAGMARDSTGNLFYATTGAAGNPSTIFKIPAIGGGFGPSIALASIPEDDVNGANEVAATGYLSLDNFGDLFGTTQSFDFNTPDTIFEISGAGNAQVASQLIVAQEPTATIVNNVISSIIVDVEDSNGNLVAGSSIPVSVRIANGTGSKGATLGGTLTVNAVGGIATFSNLNINDVGNYTLAFSAPGMNAINSVSFKITANPLDGSHLVFTTPPPPTTIAGAKMQEFKVTAEQPTDQPSKTTKGPVTLVISDGPTNGKIMGSVKSTLKQGIATFKNLKFNVAGTYIIKATGEHSIDSAPVTFQITATTPKKAVFSQQPVAKIAASTTFSVAVELKDKFGNIATTDNSSVTLTLSGGSKFAVLTGTTTQDVVDGVAGFDDLAVISPGHFTIKAADPSDNLKATSKGFRIT